MTPQKKERKMMLKALLYHKENKDSETFTPKLIYHKENKRSETFTLKLIFLLFSLSFVHSSVHSTNYLFSTNNKYRVVGFEKKKSKIQPLKWEKLR